MNTIEAPARLPKVLTSTRQRLAIVAAVLLLAAATFLANRVLPGWAYPLCGATAAGLLIALAWWARLSPSAIGLDPRHLRRALLVGLAGLGLVGLGFGIALVVPALRSMFMDARVGSPGFTQLLWLALIRIPLGTVLIDEIAFRGVLPALFGADARWRWGPVLAAAALFGLWHALPSLALTRNAMVHQTLGGLPIIAVSALAMLAAAGAGVFLHWWRHTGRGVAASMLVHLATNSGGLVIAALVLRG